jgi:hypothetical protein
MQFQRPNAQVPFLSHIPPSRPIVQPAQISVEENDPVPSPLFPDTPGKKRFVQHFKGSYLLFLIFAVIQTVIILHQGTGPFFDEAIYITAGLRTLQGKGLDDGYLVWFAGSLLWPFFAGLGYLLKGLVGVRFMALFFAFLTFIASYLTTRNLFGEKAACFTLIALLCSGPFMALAHLGVYDSPALACTAISFWAITQLKHDHRIWLCVSAIAFALAIIAKYPIVLMLLPLLALIRQQRKAQSTVDICLFLFLFTATFLTFFLSCQYEVGDWLFWSIANKPTFGATRESIAFVQLSFGLLPLLFAFAGFLLPRGKKALKLILLLAGFIWPLYHILTGNPVSDNKHVVFGFLFIYPLIGLFFAFLWEKNIFGKLLVSLSILVLIVFGFSQLTRLDAAWPDVRTPANYLMQHVQPGDKLLINDSWSYTMYLYGNKNITSPWDVFDNYRIQDHESKMDLCHYQWFVDEEGSYAWSQQVLAKMQTCAHFVRVFQYSSPVVGLGNNNQYVRYTVKTTIWKRVEGKSAT